ncbi:hypothetical protein HYC85_029923 [Camellia sinensis]|uniref:Uncharacterized protein n=1 Tax=Camellia sinensis TaxID=4442 RepID=A0A7J7FZB2_CAMSI|nr:hypothetical protein HYC85_029923 [Camellia sinensis]
MLKCNAHLGHLPHDQSWNPNHLKLAPPSTASYAENFMPEDPPLLGRIVIELSQPEAAPNLGNDVSATTGLRTDALKAEGLNKQQVLAVVAKTMEDTFATQNESSSNQGKNREKGRRTRNDPLSSKSTLGKDQQTKPVPADPFSSAPSKNSQTSKYLPQGRRVFHALCMPLSKALRILAEKGHLKPLEPRPLSGHLPPGHDVTQYCAYHQQTGYRTDNCFRLRHEVQDLFDNGVIIPPSLAMSIVTGSVNLGDNTSM